MEEKCLSSCLDELVSQNDVFNQIYKEKFLIQNPTK
jgi:hypothetical protein